VFMLLFPLIRIWRKRANQRAAMTNV